jgi:hypothetical protein
LCPAGRLLFTREICGRDFSLLGRQQSYLDL